MAVSFRIAFFRLVFMTDSGDLLTRADLLWPGFRDPVDGKTDLRIVQPATMVCLMYFIFGYPVTLMSLSRCMGPLSGPLLFMINRPPGNPRGAICDLLIYMEGVLYGICL